MAAAPVPGVDALPHALGAAPKDAPKEVELIKPFALPGADPAQVLRHDVHSASDAEQDCETALETDAEGGAVQGAQPEAGGAFEAASSCPVVGHRPVVRV